MFIMLKLNLLEATKLVNQKGKAKFNTWRVIFVQTGYKIHLADKESPYLHYKRMNQKNV